MGDIKKTGRNFTIDFFRVFFSVLIVALHSSPFIAIAISLIIAFVVLKIDNKTLNKLI